MKKTILKYLLLTAVIFLPQLAREAFACQCFRIDTPYHTYQKADAVFVGKVISVKDEKGKEVIKKKTAASEEDAYPEREEGLRYYRFAVEEWLKGSKEPEVTVAHAVNMCQFGFQAGDEFLVYAHRYKDELVTNTFCARTETAAAAGEEIMFLRDFVKGKPEPRIYGTVKLTDLSYSQGTAASAAAEGINIIAESAGRRYTAVTDQNGLYRFDKLPDGKYKVYPSPPGRYQVKSRWDEFEEINLQPETGDFFEREYRKFTGPSAYTNFDLEWNNRVSGKVLDAEGKYLENASVRLIPVDQIGKISDASFLMNKRSADFLEKVNEQSDLRKYKITGRKPGRYILAIEVYAPFAADREKVRFYYPQAAAPQQAQIIDIGESDQKEIDIKMPAGYFAQQIEGILSQPAGQIINQGYVTIEKKENSRDADNIIYDWAFVKDGHFKFQVFENGEYWLHTKVGGTEWKPVKIKVEKVNSPIKLMFTGPL